MYGQLIPEVTEHKHLGVLLSNNCSWSHHINYVKTKAWQRVNILRKHKFSLDRKALETIYISYIRPILEYANVIWYNCADYEADALEKINIECARIVTGATKLAGINTLLKEVGWETLSTRRRKHCLKLFYKMVNGLTPSYLTSLIPTTQVNQRYQLRNADNIPGIFARTSSYYNSFLPSVIRE